MDQAFLRYEQEGRIVTITMNRPDERNAIGDHAACQEMVAAFERANGDPGVSVVILTGAGTAFSAGGNLDRKSTRLNSSHIQKSRMPSSA